MYQVLNSINVIAHINGAHIRSGDHCDSLDLYLDDLIPLENADMYFANAIFFMPAIIINYLIVLITQLCCGCHVTHLHSKLSTMFTELVCIALGLLFY